MSKSFSRAARQIVYGLDIVSWVRTGRRGVTRADLQLLGKSKVDQFNVSLDVEQKVFRFQISVDDVSAVQVVKSGNDAGRVESRR